MVLHIWMTKCLRIFRIFDNIIHFTTNAMENWRVELTVGGQTLVEVKIQRCLFRGRRICRIMNFAVAVGDRVSLNGDKRRGKYLDLSREQKYWKMKETVKQILINTFGTVPKVFIKGPEDLEIRGHPDYSIIKIRQNTDNNPGDLRRLAVI